MAIPALTTWSNGQVLTSTALNANFAAIRDHYNSNAVETSGAQTIAGVKTFSAIPVLSLGLTISAGGAAITGNSSVTGTLSVSQLLTAAAGISVTTVGLTVVAGGLTVTAGGLTVTAGGATITAGNLTMSGGQAIGKRVDNGNSGASKTIDFDTGNVQRLRLTANCALTFSNGRVGGMYFVELMQDGTGSRTVTHDANLVWGPAGEPTLTTTANRKDILAVYYNGLKYVGSVFEFGINDGDTT